MIQFGLMNRGQFPFGDDLAQRWEEMLEQARWAEKLGFSSIMKGSHYTTYPLHDFQQVPFLARIMAEAPSLRLIAGIVLLPLHKPLDVAEQFASLDVMSGGRLVFGIGIGYREVEFRAFGTTMREAGPRLEENLAAIRRLWTEDKVTMMGSHFELIEASCSIKPLQQPMPPIWTGANADRAIRRAARLTDAWFVNPHNRIDTIARQMEVYKAELEACGKPFPAEFPMMREVVVAASREEAMRLAQPYLEAKYQAYHQWGQDKVMPEGDNDFAVDYDDLVRDRFLFGSPDEIAEQILDLVRRFGVNHFVMGVQFPGMPQAMVLEEMQMLAEEVFPKVRAGL
ncbi:MAG: LLM class flavin-dependent oxidoreductase [Alphaproteobacteria bacterium]|jgi:alkanesulfonate monooxygenase SsuD/methylene tetrahydromethanopterin reductase-like flavin-dependent oxidoreductase (luciferase family)|nr:LLM class flavin-dependent oxidoreductase [Alphaproteobacteria bacterium]